MTPAQKRALQQYQDSVDGYVNDGPSTYGVAGSMTPEALGDSALGDVSTDPQYKEHELAALRELEAQSKEGMTAADRADAARLESQVNRANKGRIGAIQQNMNARGMGGSGMDLVAQMQSSQDANEIAAMKALEQEGMIQDRKSAATRDLGSMSANLQNRDFNQAAEKARAKDAIASFNAQNRNRAQELNLQNKQSVSNLNTGTANDFSQSSMAAKNGAATLNYNSATEAENRRLLEEEERKKKKAAKNRAMGSAIGTGIGAVAGGVFGGPAGAAVGASAGGALGGAASDSFASDEDLKKDVKSEDDASMEHFLNELEAKSYSYKDEDKPRHGIVSKDLARSKIGSDMLRKDENGNDHVDMKDAVASLLASVAYLNKKIKG